MRLTHRKFPTMGHYDLLQKWKFHMVQHNIVIFLYALDHFIMSNKCYNYYKCIHSNSVELYLFWRKCLIIFHTWTFFWPGYGSKCYSPNFARLFGVYVKKKKKNGAIKVLNLLNIKYLIIKLLFPLEQIRLSPN